MIRTVKLDKVFRTEEIETSALNEVDLHIQKGEFVAIMGPSGCGKSTLLNIIGLLDNPTSGEYYFDNQEVGAFKERNRTLLRKGNIGFVFQSFNLIDELNVYENVELPLFYDSKIEPRERRGRAEAALEAVGLTDRMHHMPNQLSGGQQQRVAIARSLVNDPVVILADEATGNLDTRTSYEIMALLQDLNSKGKTIVFVTHEPDIAKFMTRQVVFRDGHIIREELVTDRNNAVELLKALPVEELV